MMVAFLLSLFAMLMPVVPADSAPAGASQLDWLAGTWRTDALEMTCAATKTGTACREEGRSAAMKGAAADLTFTGKQLTVALPSIPASTFTEVARDTRSVSFEMKTKMGVARLRFARNGDMLKIERGNDSGWATAMSYRRV